jgi:hypothetical protein
MRLGVPASQGLAMVTSDPEEKPMARRSRPPRNRKSRNPDAPRHDVAVMIPASDAPIDALAADARSSIAVGETDTLGAMAPPALGEVDELAELDAGWD